VKSRDERIRARLMETFRAEAEEHLQVMGGNLAAASTGLAREQELQVIDATFRSAHSLKGAARAMGIVSIESVCQAMEGVLRQLSRAELAPTSSIVAALNEGVRCVEHLLEGAQPEVAEPIVAQIAAAAATSSTPPREAVSTPESPAIEVEPLRVGSGGLDTLRIPRAQLDDLLLQGEDFLLLKLEAAERTKQAVGLIATLNTCRQAAAPLSPELSVAIRQAERLLADLRRGERIVKRSVDQLHRQTRRLRLAPVSSVFDLFPLMVQDLAADQRKEVDLVMRGTELELDLRILEAMKDPLIHLVRNAVDHGIEKPAVRLAAGKPAPGHLELRVAPIDTGRVEITVEDDGVGAAPARIRAAAVSARLLPPGVAESLSDDDALDLLFRSGFSTSAVITQISGHGLGLAIVRERVEALGGRITIESGSAGGTRMRIVLPTTVSTFRGLLVRSRDQTFLVPLESIQQTIRVAPSEIRRAEGRDMIERQSELIPIGGLDALLDLRSAPQAEPGAPGDQQIALVLRVGDERAAIVVDEILGDRDVLVRELRAPLFRIPCVASAGLLGTGAVVLVLRPSDMIAMLRSAVTAPSTVAQSVPTERTVLVADDSITTRMLIRNILEAAGYRVSVAVDGLDAWTTLKAERFDLLVSDVDMPRLGGFDLTARIRQDPEVHDLPVVLVTALDTREDKERGLAAGASAYVVKSDMEQSNLLEIVQRLV
jgi:two-component system chemotaxis sensor kinase CheA